MSKHTSKKHIHLARRKMNHVIDELYTALFRAGGKEVHLHLVKEEKGLRLYVKGDYVQEHRHEMERMAQILQPAVRDPGLVEAFWELAGGDQYTSDSELALVGQMLDSAKVDISENQVEMDLYLSFY
ncbi:MAG: hypothetical protein IKC03_01645 [Oscillospiraceae bacterium]|nr:hypothetical protein [Oscillospiraceae bacterium]